MAGMGMALSIGLKLLRLAPDTALHTYVEHEELTMAATLGTLPVKILAQVGEGELIEIGTYNIPISIGEKKTAVYRDWDGRVQVDVNGLGGELTQAAQALARQTAIPRGFTRI